MASYTRFELYLPLIYRTRTPAQSPGSPSQEQRHALEHRDVRRFLLETRRRFRGVTQANPTAPAMYKGWWQPEEVLKTVEVDHLTMFFVLAPLDRSDEAIAFLRRWKKTFEKNLHQDIVLIVHYDIHVLGGL